MKIEFELIHYKNRCVGAPDHLMINITLTKTAMKLDWIRTTLGNDEYKMHALISGSARPDVFLRHIVVDSVLPGGMKFYSRAEDCSTRDLSRCDRIVLSSEINAFTFVRRAIAVAERFDFSITAYNCSDLAFDILNCANINLAPYIRYGRGQYFCCCFFDPFGCCKITTPAIVMDAARAHLAEISTATAECTPLLPSSPVLTSGAGLYLSTEATDSPEAESRGLFWRP